MKRDNERRFMLESLESRWMLTGDVLGVVWTDTNANGARDPGELGMPGVLVYADANQDGRLTAGERVTTTSEDDPTTPQDETGTYSIARLSTDTYDIRVRSNVTSVQTFPLDSDQLPTAHRVRISSDITVGGLDFGFLPEQGKIEGHTWLDRNANGVRDIGEPLVGGVRVYLDFDDNNSPNETSEVIVTSAFDDPLTEQDETGLYRFDHIPGQAYVVRAVQPRHHTLSFPYPSILTEHQESEVISQGVATHIEIISGRLQPSDSGAVTTLELRVVWPNECWQVNSTSHFVFGDTIMIDATANAADAECTPSVREEIITVELPDLEQREYTAFATLEEVGEERRDTLISQASISFSGPEPHRLTLQTGEMRTGLDFGITQTGLGSQISGRVWHDQDASGDGIVDELKQAGVTVYADLNNNRQFDEGEPKAQTDEVGRYELTDLEAGSYSIREVVPNGFRQTVPTGAYIDSETDEVILFPDPDALTEAAIRLDVAPGSNAEDVDFANQSTETGVVSGVVWDDADLDGVLNLSEQTIGGVTVYVDKNLNGAFDLGEPHDVTLSETTVDGLRGHFSIAGLTPGLNVIRQVESEEIRLSQAQLQTTSDVNDRVVEAILSQFPNEPGGSITQLLPGQQMVINLPNQTFFPASIAGTVWEDLNGNQQRDETEAGLAGAVVYIDTNGNGLFDEGERSTTTNDLGSYRIEGIVPANSMLRVMRPDGFRFTLPTIAPPNIPSEPSPDDGLYEISLTSNENVAGVDFGLRQFAEPGQISGLAYRDANGNGQFDDGEPRYENVLVFADFDQDGTLDADEPRTRSAGPAPVVVGARPGEWSLELLPGEYRIRAQVPFGHRQTQPDPSQDIENLASWSYRVVVDPRSTTEDVSFGFQAEQVDLLAEVTAWVFFAPDGQDHPSLTTVYVDSNENGRWDPSEFSVIIQPGNPATFPVTTEEVVVGQILPAGYRQVFPTIQFGWERGPSRPLHPATSIEELFLSGTYFLGAYQEDEVTFFVKSVWNTPSTHVDTRIEIVDGTINVELIYEPSAQVDNRQAEFTLTLSELDFGTHDLNISAIERVGGTNGLSYEATATIDYNPETAYRFNLLRDGPLLSAPFRNERIPLAGDANGDHEVNFADFLVFSQNFGRNTDVVFADGDFNEDNAIDFQDFLILSANFGMRQEQA